VGLSLMSLILAINLLGDQLRDKLDVKGAEHA
jgi:ABC-type dipeptide/oligopeptide/nickel transport system permease subunit